MSQNEQLKKMRLEILGDVTNESKDDVFKLKLDDAEIVALNTLFPYDFSKKSIESEKNKRLANWQTRCAIELYKAMERIGYQSYSENGLSVQFLTSLLSNDLLGELIPKAGAIK